MSVVQGDRSLSEKKFWKQSLKVEAEITVILLHDFGIRDRIMSLDKYIEYMKMSPDDAVVFKEVCKLYDIDHMELNLPDWYIDKIRNWAFDCLIRIRQNLRDAWSVYPYYESQYYKRRDYQDDARRACSELLDIFLVMKRCNILKAEKYVQFITDINVEIQLIRDWSKRENSILRQIKLRQAGTKTIGNGLAPTGGCATLPTRQTSAT